MDKCPDCGKEFIDKIALRGHQNIYNECVLFQAQARIKKLEEEISRLTDELQEREGRIELMYGAKDTIFSLKPQSTKKYRMREVKE